MISRERQEPEVPFPDVSDRSLNQLISLEGRSAAVTGAARGLGLAVARRLAEAGAAVMIGDVDGVAAELAAAELAKQFGSDVLPMTVDVSDSSSVAGMADAVVSAWGAIDIWVNNAGVYPSTPILEMSDEDWDRVLDINLRGVFIGCREAARGMIHAGQGGVIVNMASIAGLGGRRPGVSHYVASKHGIVGLTKQLALELAKDGIRVLAVAPTTILTPGVEVTAAGLAADAGVGIEELITGIMGRPGRPDDVARVVLFCASDLSMFMTGSTVLVDAGEMAR
jgi:NAD(P)-dependent dehydrogenase (short-subunit alcohol dehydrogenase family)